MLLARRIVRPSNLFLLESWFLFHGTLGHCRGKWPRQKALPSFITVHDLSSSVIQPIIPESTKITYISHNFALWQNFPFIYRFVDARLKILFVGSESARAEYLALTGPRAFLCDTHEILRLRAAFRLPSVITSFAMTRYNYSRPIFGNLRSRVHAVCV